jgi:hypothetical protein
MILRNSCYEGAVALPVTTGAACPSNEAVNDGGSAP